LSPSDLSIRRPVLAVMLIAALLVLGWISLGRLEMQMDPDIEFPFLSVVTELPGGSPETVEREVTDVLEEQINTLEGLRTLRSVSSQGLSRIGIEFGLQYDVDVKAQEVRDKVALARPLLPLDAENPVVQKFDMNAISLLTIVLGGSLSLREISDLAVHDVKERLERLPGVGGVRILGARQREVRVWLDPLRLQGYGLAIEDVSDTLRRENAELASGRLEGPDREWSLTTQGKARHVDEFGDLVVAERAGRLIRLRDVALVEDGMADARTIARLDGRPGVALEIQRQSGADLVDIARHVRAEVKRIRSQLPEGVDITIGRDYAIYIEAQVHSVFFDIMIATLLVVTVVLLFLRDWRSTLIGSLAIPTSIISSFFFFYLLDLSLNVMTLIALALAVGLVIDDAIVVLESVYRRLEAGEEPMRAAANGARQVGIAVVSTTLAVCAVFVPIVFMQSPVGRYFYEFGVAMTVAVCISTLVALTLTPMLASRTLRVSRAHGRFFGALERGQALLDRGYRVLLAQALRHRAITVAAALGAVVGGCGVAATLPFDLYTREDLNEASVSAKLPIGTPLEMTDQMLRRMEAAIAAHPDVRVVFAVAGDEVQHRPQRARMDVMLHPKAERRRPIEKTFDEIRVLLRAAAPEAEEISVGYPAYAAGEDAEFEGLMYSLRGPDLARLERFAGQLLARMHEDPLLVDVRSSFETGRPEVTLEVERGRAADLGLSTAAIGRTLRTLFAGEKVGSFEDGGRRYDVRVQVLPEYRDDPARLSLVRVRSARGELAPLSNAAEVRIGEGPVEIRRESRTRAIELSANMAAGVPLGEGSRRIETWGREIGISAPDALVPGGAARTMQETADDISFAFGLGLIALYMVLASLFNSFLHPLTIMVSAPLSFIGGFLALALAGMSLDMMSGIGLLVLMGLVMKNGILLVDYTNQLRDAGRSRDEAILEAGPVRMRPVLMTSGALVFGMLPTVLSQGVGVEFRAPMATIMIGGLITSTALTLLVVPVVYSLLDSAAERLRALLFWGLAAARARRA
jgi:hydrophobic/amphiphilic exporter-1 (mainly G- bacteria), HAE1 family